jgi:hypothetical protein
MAIWTGLAGVGEDTDDVLDSRLDSLRDGGRTGVGIDDEVRDARHDASGGGLTHGLQGGLQHREVAATDDLSGVQEGTSASTGPIDVAVDVGITQQRIDTRLGHDRSLKIV